MRWPLSNAVALRDTVFSPWLPASQYRLRHDTQQADVGQGLLRYGLPYAKTVAHFAFEFVRDATCVFLSTQCSPPPFAGLRDQLIVL